MTTYTALTTLSGEDAAYQLSDDLEALTPEPTGVGVFEIEDGSGLWEVAAYFTDRPDPAGFAVLEALHGVKPFVISEIPDQDWVSKVRRELAPVTAGRFFVYGAHDAGKVPADKTALLIEAAMAFGTGHHGTTLGCLTAFDQLLNEGVAPKSVIDVGCGTAVLAMAAAAVLDADVMASDIDPVAVDVAEANLAANDMAGTVDCLVAAGMDAAPIAAKAPFDLVFANILKGPLIALAPDIAAACAPGGYVILSGILNTQADEVIAAYGLQAMSLHRRAEVTEWTTLTLHKA